MMVIPVGRVGRGHDQGRRDKESRSLSARVTIMVKAVTSHFQGWASELDNERLKLSNCVEIVNLTTTKPRQARELTAATTIHSGCVCALSQGRTGAIVRLITMLFCHRCGDGELGEHLSDRNRSLRWLERWT